MRAFMSGIMVLLAVFVLVGCGGGAGARARIGPVSGGVSGGAKVDKHGPAVYVEAAISVERPKPKATRAPSKSCSKCK